MTRMNTKMNAVTRLLTEYSALGKILQPGDLISMLMATAANAPAILRSRKLTALDAAMSRNMTVKYSGVRIVMPLADVDAILAGKNDNPTFGNLREIYARDCYLEHLRLSNPQRNVLDLGANRGMFTLLALAALGAETAVGIEPVEHYSQTLKLLLDANGIRPERAPRYAKFISSPSVETTDPSRNISIQTILRHQKLERFNLIKMDIEGHEKTVFSEPEWLSSVDNITMELHPHFVGDLSLIPQALEHYSFKYRHIDQMGRPVDINSAMFLVASRTDELDS